MFFILSKLLDVLLSPLVWGLVLLVSATPWRSRGVHGSVRPRLLGATGAAVLLLASTRPVANAMLRALEHTATATYDPESVYDVVVVLGGVNDEVVSVEHGQPAYDDNVERLLRAYDLLRDAHAKMAIITGAAMDARYAEGGDGTFLAAQLERWGISRSRLIVEPRARNTRENALYAKAIVEERGFAKVLVVTSAFHLARARECFAAVGMTPAFLPVDFRARHAPYALGDYLPRAKALEISSAVIREWAGRYIYRLSGYGHRVD